MPSGYWNLPYQILYIILIHGDTLTTRHSLSGPKCSMLQQTEDTSVRSRYVNPLDGAHRWSTFRLLSILVFAFVQYGGLREPLPVLGGQARLDNAGDHHKTPLIISAISRGYSGRYAGLMSYGRLCDAQGRDTSIFPSSPPLPMLARMSSRQ